ncbi:MAG: ROK family protein [Clostridiales bacterium]|nr:ROK family protein [Clostridiales bacterium]
MTELIDGDFLPFETAFRRFKQSVEAAANVPFAFCAERNDGFRYRVDLKLFADAERADENYRIAERLLKTVLWTAGAYRVYAGGDHDVYKRLEAAYSASGARAFDYGFMSKIYEKPFTLKELPIAEIPPARQSGAQAGGNLNGCRIGFDAGGSDRKVSAVIDGNVVFSDETVWNPKLNADPRYHIDGVLDSFKKAAAHMPRVDAIGVSSAGVYINNRAMAASLFIKVSDEDFERFCKDIYINCAKEYNAPVVVANDGDVTALAGAAEFGTGRILGIAMGTSEAAGYIDKDKRLNGWLNELAFVPVDLSEAAAEDEWSGDTGCGVKYFSQDGVIKLAEKAGHKFAEGLTPARKLEEIQGLLADGSPLAKRIFENIGVYLGYSIAWYRNFYDFSLLLILGRVTSGTAGAIIIENAKSVLKDKFPEYADIRIETPDEKNKRVGQSIAAASLPAVRT